MASFVRRAHHAEMLSEAHTITNASHLNIIVLPASPVGESDWARSAQQINIVVNWVEELKARVPVN
jgi:hypothetical protein